MPTGSCSSAPLSPGWLTPGGGRGGAELCPRGPLWTWRGPPSTLQLRPLRVVVSAHWSGAGLLQAWGRGLVERRQVGHLFKEGSEERGEPRKARQRVEGGGGGGRAGGLAESTVQICLSRGLGFLLAGTPGSLHDLVVTTPPCTWNAPRLSLGDSEDSDPSSHFTSKEISAPAPSSLNIS